MSGIEDQTATTKFLLKLINLIHNLPFSIILKYNTTYCVCKEALSFCLYQFLVDNKIYFILILRTISLENSDILL